MAYIFLNSYHDMVVIKVLMALMFCVKYIGYNDLILKGDMYNIINVCGW